MRTFSLFYIAFLLSILPCLLRANGQETFRIEDVLDRDLAGYLSIESPHESLLKLDQIGLLQNQKLLKVIEIFRGLEVFDDLDISTERLQTFTQNVNALHFIVHRSRDGNLGGSLLVSLKIDVDQAILLNAINNYSGFFAKLIQPSRGESNEDGAPLFVQGHKNWPVISNDEQNGKTLVANISNGKSDRPLSKSRRFALSEGAVSASDYDLFIFLNPARWQEIAIKNKWVVERKWNANAFGEISLICFGVNLLPEETDCNCKIAVNGYAAFTNPRSGIGTVLEAYQPIEKFPPLVDNPVSVTAVRKNNQLFMERNREIFDAIHGNGVFDRQSKSFWFNWNQGLKPGLGGTEFNCWYGGNAYFTNHLGFKELAVSTDESEMLVSRIDEYFENRSKGVRGVSPIQRQDIHGYPAWFRDDELAKTAFLNQRPYLKAIDLDASFEFPNPGAIIWNEWQVFVNRKQALKLLEGSEDEITKAPTGTFGGMYHDLVKRYGEGRSPFYIESHWKPHWEIRLSQIQLNLAFYLFADSNDVNRRLVYSANENDRTIEAGSPKENLLNIVTLIGGALIDECGQTTYMLTKTEDGNLSISAGLYAPAKTSE